LTQARDIASEQRDRSESPFSAKSFGRVAEPIKPDTCIGCCFERIIEATKPETRSADQLVRRGYVAVSATGIVQCSQNRASDV
jgi:hypothetical protein